MTTSQEEPMNRVTDDGPARDPLAPLFRHANARPSPPEADEQAVRSLLRAEWKALVGARRKRRIGVLAVAASVVLATSIVVLQPAREPAPSAAPLATIVRQSGLVYTRPVTRPPSEARRLASEAVSAGQVLHTADGAWLGLEWSGGLSMRLDQNSELALLGADTAELISGSVYIDSGAGNGLGQSAPEIRTHAGVVRHLGTQYLTAIKPGGISVSVREGRVQVEAQGVAATAGQGEQLIVNLQGQVARRFVPTHGKLWAWTEQVIPKLDLDGMSAWDFVHWAGRETGRLVVFDSEAAERLARQTGLRGEVSLEPSRALELILQTSDLEHQIANSEILVRIRPGSS